MNWICCCSSSCSCFLETNCNLSKVKPKSIQGFHWRDMEKLQGGLKRGCHVLFFKLLSYFACSMSLPSPPLPFIEVKTTLYSLSSVCKFSLLISTDFLWYLRGEVVQQSRASWVHDHYLYSHGLNVWFRGDIVGRNKMPITLWEKNLNRVSCD